MNANENSAPCKRNKTMSSITVQDSKSTHFYVYRVGQKSTLLYCERYFKG